MPTYRTNSDSVYTSDFMKGYEIVLRDNGSGEEIPYAIIGSYDPDKHELVFIEDGNVHFDGEPVTLDNLIERINNVVNVGSRIVMVPFDEEKGRPVHLGIFHTLLRTSRVIEMMH